jgi:hypothetical protein
MISGLRWWSPNTVLPGCLVGFALGSSVYGGSNAALTVQNN